MKKTELIKFLYDIQGELMYKEDQKLAELGSRALQIRETLIPNGMDDFIGDILKD